MRRNELLHPAVERNSRRRESGVLAASQHGLEATHRLDSQARHRHGKLGCLVLDGIEPVRVGTWVLQEPVARAQRTLERIDAAAMVGIDRQRQAVEKAPALRW